MKQGLMLFFLLLSLLSGCSAGQQRDNYIEVSYELCGTNVKIYSVSDDGRLRVVCQDGGNFALSSAKSLKKMQDINLDYCDGQGLGKFSETTSRYLFQCKSGSLLSINKANEA